MPGGKHFWSSLKRAGKSFASDWRITMLTAPDSRPDGGAASGICRISLKSGKLLSLRPAATSCLLLFWRRLCEPKFLVARVTPPCLCSSFPKAILTAIPNSSRLIPFSAGDAPRFCELEEIRVHSLHELGWCSFFEKQWQQKQEERLVRARVSEENRGLYKVISGSGETWAELRGKLRHEATSREMLAAVGDWVLAEEHGERSTIHFVFERLGKFSRKVAGKKIEEQIVAANVDTVFLVSSLNREFNPRRIERYLALAWESGARPIVVLNKSDLCENVSALCENAEAAAMGMRVVVASIVSGEGVAELREIVRTGGTTALLGSSGVGKSSLINAILGREIQVTSETRESDDKGRHTTTSRQLIVVPGGGVLLDTPGKRRNFASVCRRRRIFGAMQIPGLHAQERTGMRSPRSDG